MSQFRIDRRTGYFLFALALLLYRLVVNFRYDLIPGIGGGYYPVQIRAILDTGLLAFRDMPLYFYLNALVVKLIWLISGNENGQIILLVSRIFDSCIPPLLVIPLYKLNDRYSGGRLNPAFEGILLAFGTFSIAPLFMVAEASKNSSAYPLMAFFLFYLFEYLRSPSRKSGWLAGLFLVLTGLTHFGVFSVSVGLLLISLPVFYGKRAIMVMLTIMASGIGFVYLFDPGRASTLLWLPLEMFGFSLFFHGPEPYVLITIPTTLICIAGGIYVIARWKRSQGEFSRKVLLILVIGTAFFSLPVLGREYFNRFALILFIPHFILLMILMSVMDRSLKKVMILIAGLTVVASCTYTLLHPKTPVLSEEAYADLKVFGMEIGNPGNTLVIPRHGIEWWTSWELRTKVGGTRSLDRESFYKYEKILILVQKQESYHRHMPSHFAIREPELPPDPQVFYESDHFLAVELDLSDLSFYIDRH